MATPGLGKIWDGYDQSPFVIMGSVSKTGGQSAGVTVEVLEERGEQLQSVFSFQRPSSSPEEQGSLAEVPAALGRALMVPRSGLQHAAVTSYANKLQCLR